MPAMHEDERRVASAAVRQAASLCRSARAEGFEKQDRSPVTVADFGSQALICRALLDAFPDDPVIAEEDSATLRKAPDPDILGRVVRHVQAIWPGADADAVCHWIDRGGERHYVDRFWALDPIDGTKGFLRGQQYAIALALIVNGQVMVAALGCPNLPMRDDAASPVGVIFTAVSGQGAMVEPLASEEPAVPVHVNDTTDPSAARFCESVEVGHSSHANAAAVARHLGVVTEPYRMDSQCKYAIVARGSADIYLCLPTRADYIERIWDHAAGSLVVSEAGGTVSDAAGNPLDFTRGSGLDKNRGVIVTNARLHERVLEALRAVGVA